MQTIRTDRFKRSERQNMNDLPTESPSTNRKPSKQPRKANRQAYAEPYRDLKTRVGFAMTFMRKSIEDKATADVAKAMIESAIEILEGK